MSPIMTRVLALTVVLAPTLALVVARRRLGALKTASWLVIWGVVIAVSEHATWAMRLAVHERLWLNPHSVVHYFMAGAYTAIGGVFLGVIARTLLREGRRAGWYAVLFALLVGGTLEVVMNGPTGLLFQHGFGPESTPGGEAIFGYPLAWLAGLAIGYRPIFGEGGRTESADLVSHGREPRAYRRGIEKELPSVRQLGPGVMGRGLESNARGTG